MHTVAPTSLVQLDCKPASPTSLHLNWTESNTTDCPVEEYLVQYAVNDSITLKSSLKATVDEGYQLGDLRPWTTYTVWVTPLNNGGPGLKSNVVHCKTEQSGKEVSSFSSCLLLSLAFIFSSICWSSHYKCYIYFG